MLLKNLSYPEKPFGQYHQNSRDSKYFGFVERKVIVGKAKGVIGSFDITDEYQPRFKLIIEPIILIIFLSSHKIWLVKILARPTFTITYLFYPKSPRFRP